MDNEYCFLCGRNGSTDPLDTHHLFGGAFRSRSDKYGLTVRLCHNSCHIFGKYAAHHNADTMKRLRIYGQQKAMKEQGWSTEDFIRVFGKSYI